MKGIELKKVLMEYGLSITEVAAAIGKSQQTLSAALLVDDVKSGLVESIAALIGVPVSTLYGEGNTATANGNGTAVAGTGNNVNDGRLIDEISAQRRLTEQALSQNDRLIGIIHDLTKPA